MSERRDDNVCDPAFASPPRFEGVGPRRRRSSFTRRSPPLSAASPFEKFVGVWRGGGEIVGTNGHRESIRCRAEYSEAKDGAALNQSIVCASESFKFDIRATSKPPGSGSRDTGREAREMYPVT